MHKGESKREGNRLFWVIILYILAEEVVPSFYQFVVVLKQVGLASGVMG